jgi:hypothetical protein
MTCFYFVIDQNKNKMQMLYMQMSSDSRSSSSESSSSSSESDLDPRFLGSTDVDDAFQFAFDPMLIALAPDPPPETSFIPVRPNTILTPPSDGFFVFATCIFHAGIATEGTAIRTKRCPPNLHMIAKNNLGCADVSQGRSMDIMPTIMRNNKTAEDILKESMIACLSGLKSTCSAFEAAPAPESADPEKFAKLKSEVKLKCGDTEKRIKAVGVNGLSELRLPKTQPEQLAVLFNACEKGNAFANGVYYGTMLTLNDSVLNKTNRLNMERFVGQLNYIDYGVPKQRYMPSKTYYLNEPFGFTRINTPLDVFIDEHLYSRLHLAVGVRFGSESYTAQLDVNLRALKASDTITLDEVVKLLVSPTLARRVVELVCEKHPKLNAPGNKDALIGLSEKEDTWQVALFDHGCSGIHVEGYPQLLHVGPEHKHKTTKKNNRNVVVLSAPAHGSRPPRTQTIRLKKMKQYLTRDEPDDLFTTLMKKRKRSDSSSDESIKPSSPKTPKQDLTDADVESSLESSLESSVEGGSKRSQCKRSQCKRSQCKRSQCKRSQCKRSQCKRSQCKRSQCKRSQCKRRGQCKRGRTRTRRVRRR